MLLRDHVVKALEYHYCASPLVVGDTIGEDKFRVLDIMRKLERDGQIVRIWNCPYESDRMAADRLHFTTIGNYEAARFPSEPARKYQQFNAS